MKLFEEIIAGAEYHYQRTGKRPSVLRISNTKYGQLRRELATLFLRRELTTLFSRSIDSSEEFIDGMRIEITDAVMEYEYLFSPSSTDDPDP